MQFRFRLGKGLPERDPKTLQMIHPLTRNNQGEVEPSRTIQKQEALYRFTHTVTWNKAVPESSKTPPLISHLCIAPQQPRERACSFALTIAVSRTNGAEQAMTVAPGSYIGHSDTFPASPERNKGPVYYHIMRASSQRETALR